MNPGLVSRHITCIYTHNVPVPILVPVAIGYGQHGWTQLSVVWHIVLFIHCTWGAGCVSVCMCVLCVCSSMCMCVRMREGVCVYDDYTVTHSPTVIV